MMLPLRSVYLIAVSVVALFLAACGGGGGGASDTNMLRRGIGANPDTLDPHKSSAAWERIILDDMFVGLFTAGVDGEPLLGLAESYEIDETGTVWTFKLRDWVWSDGVAITAEDFVFSMQRLQAPETAAQYASLLYVIKNAEGVNTGTASPDALGVRALDPKTLEIELEYPAPYLPELLTLYSSYPVPPHIVKEHGERWVRPENIVVNGPYKVDYWRTGEVLVSSKNPNWPGTDELCFDQVGYFPIPDNSAVERKIEAGELDMNSAFDGTRQDELKERLPGWVRSGPTLVTTYWVFNTSQAPFDDVRVRNALAMVLDREFLTENVLTPGFQPAYSFVPPGISNYVAPVDQPKVRWAELSRTERLEEARRLLSEAGYGPDNPLQFEYMYRSTDDNQKPPPVAQQNWKEIADWVEPSLLLQDTRVLYERLRFADFEMSDAGWIADYNDPQNFLYLLDSRTGQLNYGNYNNAEFDALIAQSNRETDLTKRAGLLAAAEQIMLDDMPLSPMWFQVSKNLVDPTLTGFVDNVQDVHPSRYLCRLEGAQNGAG